MPWYSSVHRGSGVKSQVGDGGVRGRPRRRRRVRRRTRRTTTSCSCATRPRRSTSSPPRCPRARACSAPRSSTTPTCCRGAATTSDAALPAARPTSCSRPASGRCAAPGADRRSSRSPARRTSPARSGRSPSSPRSPTTTARELFVDAAQLAPHRPIDMAARGDRPARALGPQALRARSARARWSATQPRLREAAPLLRGGGAIKLVTLDDVIWADAPERHEAGSPNVVGVVALGAACRSLVALGMDAVAAHERALAARLRRGLRRRCPGSRRSRSGPADHVDRVGVATFNLAGYRHPLLAAILSAEHAIGVRHGCFCAHPLITHLLGIAGRGARAAARRAARRPAGPRCPARCARASGSARRRRTSTG